MGNLNLPHHHLMMTESMEVGSRPQYIMQLYVGPFSSVIFSVALLISSFSRLETKSPGKMMPINTRRDSLLGMRPFRRGRYFDKVRRFLCLFTFAVFANYK